MLFRKQYKLGLLKPDATKEGPICMDSYRWMFDCCRVPGPEGLDWCVTYAKPGDTGDSGHIVVFRNNRPWKVQTAVNGRILSTEELQTCVFDCLIILSCVYAHAHCAAAQSNTS
jgi:carnitine O-acetyltransferase